MKVYAQPEVLEENIAPAAITIMPDGTITVSSEPPTVGSNLPINGGNIVSDGNNVIQVVPSSSLSLFDPIVTSPAEPLVLSDHLSDFNIHTIRVGVNDSLFGEPTINLQNVVFQVLVESSPFESTLAEVTASGLAGELSASNDVIAAIDSAVGKDRSAELVGLSSDEFSRTSGSAFLTSL
jgi:hypothetical protein